MMRPRLVLVLLGLCVGCTDAEAPAPRPLRIIPSSGATSRPLAITIEGEDFNPEVKTDFGRRSASEVDAQFEAFLGEHALTDVTLTDDGRLLATIPEGIPTGSFALRVSNPSGQQGVLENAFRVVTSAESAAAFVIEPLGAQRAGVPFAVGVAAVDAEGRVVEAFTGSVQVTARGDTVTPSSLGPFVLGRLRGAQLLLTTPAIGQQLTVEDAAGHRGESAPFDVVVGPVQRASILGPARTTAGACTGPFAVTLLDAAGNATSFGEPTTLGLTVSPPLNGALFEDAACAQPTTGVQLFAGAQRAELFGRFARTGSYLLEVAGAALPTVSHALDVDAGVAVQLGFVTPSRITAAGDCSDPISIAGLDGQGNPTVLAATTDLTITVAPDAGVALFTDGCLTALSGPLPLGPSAQTATLRLSAQSAGQYTLQVNAAGLADATQPQLVTP